MIRQYKACLIIWLAVLIGIGMLAAGCAAKTIPKNLPVKNFTLPPQAEIVRVETGRLSSSLMMSNCKRDWVISFDCPFGEEEVLDHFLAQFAQLDYRWVFPGGSPAGEMFCSADGMIEVTVNLRYVNSDSDYSVAVKELENPSPFLNQADKINLDTSD
ncbi:hypothetical protein JW859_09440 [bacterium]|nr:hypothetical protein [bacterium]